MELKLLYELLRPFENKDLSNILKKNKISKTDFYIDGLSGRENSSAIRAEFAKKLNLPTDMTANALLAATRILISYEEYLKLVDRK